MNEAKKIRGSILYHGFMIIFGFLMLYPVLWLLASSFKNSSEVFTDAASLIPSKLNFSNYAEGWKGFGGNTFGVFFKNSFFIVFISMVAQVLTSSLAAFGFGRIKFKGKKFWFACMIVSMMMPAEIILIPQYLIFSKLHWINSYLPLIVPAFFGLPFFIFLIMQFLTGLPIELDESAKIDGCNTFDIYLKIIFPLLAPALITSMIFSFYWKWQDFLSPLIYLNKSKLYPVSLALKLFADPSSQTNYGALFAMSVLSLIPVIGLFLMFQRYLVEGISTTGMKG